MRPADHPTPRPILTVLQACLALLSSSPQPIALVVSFLSILLRAQLTALESLPRNASHSSFASSPSFHVVWAVGYTVAC